MNMGYVIPAAVLAAVLLLVSAVPAADGSGCIDSVNDDGVMDDAEAERIIAELQLSAADADGEVSEVCLYSFGCPTLTVPSELFSAVQSSGAAMSLETRYGKVAFDPGSAGRAVFPDGTDVSVTVDRVDPLFYHEDFVGDGLVTQVGVDNAGDLSMVPASVSVLFQPDDRHSAEDLEVYYLWEDKVVRERLEDVRCEEGCDGVVVTFDADRAGQYAVVYSEDTEVGVVNIIATVAMVGFLLVFLAGVALWVRRM